MTDFLFSGSVITTDCECSHEIRSWLLLGRKAITNLDSVLKRKDITLLTIFHIVKAMIFSVFRNRCETSTLKEAEQQRINAFELWCWRRLLRAPWTARGSNQSVLKEITLNICCKDWYSSWSLNTLSSWWQEPTYWKRPWWWERLKVKGKRSSRG